MWVKPGYGSQFCPFHQCRSPGLQLVTCHRQQGVGNPPGLHTALPRARLYQPLLPSGKSRGQNKKEDHGCFPSADQLLCSKAKCSLTLKHCPFLIKKPDQQGWSYTKEGMAPAPPAASRCHAALGEKQPLTDSPGPASAAGMPWTVKHFLISLTPGASRANQAVASVLTGY